MKMNMKVKVKMKTDNTSHLVLQINPEQAALYTVLFGDVQVSQCFKILAHAQIYMKSLVAGHHKGEHNAICLNTGNLVNFSPSATVVPVNATLTWRNIQ